MIDLGSLVPEILCHYFFSFSCESEAVRDQGKKCSCFSSVHLVRLVPRLFPRRVYLVYILFFLSRWNLFRRHFIRVAEKFSELYLDAFFVCLFALQARFVLSCSAKLYHNFMNTRQNSHCKRLQLFKVFFLGVVVQSLFWVDATIGLTYAISVWGNCSTLLLQSLNGIHARACRIMKKKYNQSSVIALP